MKFKAGFDQRCKVYLLFHLEDVGEFYLLTIKTSEMNTATGILHNFDAVLLLILFVKALY